MTSPTDPQLKVLVALHRRSRSVAQLIASATETQNTTGNPPDRAWFEYFHHTSVAREALTAAAHAGAIPNNWIGHVRERGDRGRNWNPDASLPPPEPVDWDRVLGGLTADVQRLQQAVALSVGHRLHPTIKSQHLSVAIDRYLRVLHARTAGISNLIGITAEQGNELWGTEHDWVDAATELISTMTFTERDTLWRQTARATTTTYSVQTTTLANAGIIVTDTAALPDLDALLPAMRTALASGPIPGVQPGHATGVDISTVSTAVDIALEAGRAEAETVSADHQGPDPWNSDFAGPDRPGPPAMHGPER